MCTDCSGAADFFLSPHFAIFSPYLATLLPPMNPATLSLLRVSVEGQGYVGFVDIHPGTTLRALREALALALDAGSLPQHYVFVQPSGVLVGTRHERRLAARDFLPELRLAPTAESPLALRACVSLWSGAASFACWALPASCTVAQLRSEACRFWRLSPADTLLTDGEGGLWPDGGRAWGEGAVFVLRMRDARMERALAHTAFASQDCEEEAEAEAARRRAPAQPASPGAAEAPRTALSHLLRAFPMAPAELSDCAAALHAESAAAAAQGLAAGAHGQHQVQVGAALVDKKGPAHLLGVHQAPRLDLAAHAVHQGVALIGLVQRGHHAHVEHVVDQLEEALLDDVRGRRRVAEEGRVEGRREARAERDPRDNLAGQPPVQELVEPAPQFARI